MADEPDRHPDDISSGQAHVHRLKLEKLWTMPENPNEADRLRAVLPTGLKHAESLGARIAALEGKLPEVRDYFGAKILPGVQIAYVSPGMRPTLSHGIVLGIEPCRRRLLKAALQIHVKTHRGAHVRLFDPQRVIVLGR